jgi:hypothetical protein
MLGNEAQAQAARAGRASNLGVPSEAATPSSCVLRSSAVAMAWEGRVCSEH